MAGQKAHQLLTALCVPMDTAHTLRKSFYVQQALVAEFSDRQCQILITPKLISTAELI